MSRRIQMTVEFKQVKNDVKITSTPWMRLIPTLKASFKYILLTASLTVAVSFFISHFLGLFLLLFTPEGLEVMSVPIKGVPVIIYPTPVVIPLEINVGSLFIILWTFQLSCLLIAITSREGVLTTVRNTLKGSVKSIFKSNIISTPLIANATLLTVLAIYTLQEAQGIPTGALPETNRYKFYFLLTQASIFEELTFRVFLIGVFEAVTTLHLYSLTHPNERKLKRSAIFLRALLFPHKTLESLGLKDVWRKERMGLTPEEWFILALSSVMFGSAHVLSGIGWEIGKVTHATLVGVVLGLMYMKFGFQASIILHWFFNNYFEAYYMASELIPIGLFSDLLDWLNMSLGVVFWVTAAGVLMAKVIRLTRGKRTSGSSQPKAGLSQPQLNPLQQLPSRHAPSYLST